MTAAETMGIRERCIAASLLSETTLDERSSCRKDASTPQVLLLVSMTISVAIIGGGAVGLSTALHLVERGVTNVTVLEADDLAAGSSSRSAGFVESQYVDPLDVELRARSMHVFRRLQRDAGLDIKEIGYLRLAPDDAALNAFEASARLQRELGIDHATVLDAAAVRRLVPWLRPDGIAGGLWGPRDGRIDGPDYCQILAKLAQAGGARVRTEQRVVAVTPTASGHRIETLDCVVECDVVVNAAGPWAALVGELLGVDVPVVPLRNQIGIWRLDRPLPRVLPMVMDYIPHSGARGLYVATYDDAQHVLAGLHSEELLGEAVDPTDYDQDADDHYLAETRSTLERRMPDLPLAEVERAWAGLYPVSPDGLPIVGPAPGHWSVILAVGGGGSGIQLSPIMGALAADWIAYGEPRSVSDGRLVAPDPLTDPRGGTSVPSAWPP
jgi:glycine/D-amino acid oxidase-like deaminating enzyme